LKVIKNWIPFATWILTRGPGDATSLAKQAEEEGYDFLMVSGGDGTINEAMNGLVGSSTVLGILPSGTGNSLAREVGLPINPRKALEVLRKGKTHDVYLGLANGKYFGLMVGIGFDAEAVHHVSYSLKRIFGRWSYILSGIRSLFCYHFPVFKMVVDGQEFEATTVVICKARYYASSIQIAPKASLQSPTFQVFLYNGRGFWDYLRLCFSVMMNRHTRLKGAAMMEAKEVTIKPGRGILAQMDGEVLLKVPTSIRIAQKQIKVLFSE
jgi:YegS/Rv2252/BmrU family lipid kinase